MMTRHEAASVIGIEYLVPFCVVLMIVRKR